MDHASSSSANRPQPNLSVTDTVALLIGMVIGIGIFKLPALVAMNTSGEFAFLMLWVAGGVISIIGALCYAELCNAHPDAGGEYHFLTRAFGPSLGFLFAWARMTVIQTGAIALVAFLTGDYATRILNLGAHSSAIYAALTVALLTALNIAGTLQSKLAQKVLEIGTVGLMIVAIVIGLMYDGGASAPAQTATASLGFTGLAMVFVLLTYGGWNEIAYLSAEIKDIRRNMLRIVFIGIGLVTLLYLLMNLAYLNVLGFAGMRASQAVGADLMQKLLGRPGEVFLSVTVVLAALTTANAAIITGARTNYALGRDFSIFRYLGQWDKRAAGPVNALLVQGAIALALVGLGTVTGKDFVAMVEYTAPVFWFFLLLTGVSLFVFRRREDAATRPFQVPLYPITPAIFVLVCGYMLYSSLAYTGIGAMVGVAVLIAGLPVLWWSHRKGSSQAG